MKLAIFILLVAGMSWIYKKLFVPCPINGSPKRIGFGGWVVVLAATTLLLGALKRADARPGEQPGIQQIHREFERVERRLGELDDLVLRYDGERKHLETRIEKARKKGVSLEEARRDPRLGEAALRLTHLEGWLGQIEDRREELRARWLELDRNRFRSRHLHDLRSSIGPPHRTTPASRTEYGSLERDARHGRQLDTGKTCFWN